MSDSQVSDSQRVVIFLMGATATGKTELALQLHDLLPCELISVDSAMVYRGLDIGTAKPSRDILDRVPHHLIDIRDPAEGYSVAEFRQAALEKIEEIFRAGAIPILVGGTGLYFRKLEQGLDLLPSVDHEVRKRLSGELSEVGCAGLHERLMEVDPIAASRINVNDPQRIQRALEVYEITGEPMSSLLKRGESSPPPFKIFKIILAPDRQVLRERVELRFLRMLELGLVDEVRQLFARSDLKGDLQSMKVVGYRQIWQYLEGKIDFETMQRDAITATQQLVKRQFTWLRSEKDAIWHDTRGAGLVPTSEAGLVSGASGSIDGSLLDKILAKMRTMEEFVHIV